MKESRSCHTCQRHSYNLMSATCGHKICFHCVKGNKNSHKCSLCLPQTNPRPKSYLSPSRNISQQPKERSTKVKDSDSKMHSECSPHNLHRSRPSLHKSSVIIDQQSSDPEPTIQQILNCKQHNEPLSLYCKSNKELICSVCLCNRSKQSGDILPLKAAEDHLRKENKLNREQSKIILGNIENAQKIVGKNVDIFRSCYNNSLQTLQTFFDDLHKDIQAAQKKMKAELNTFFDRKFKQCDQIQQDLSYLNSILRQFKENNKDTCSFNELLFLLTSFKVIKGTVKNLDLDYLPYNKEIQMVEINKYHFKETLKDVVKIKMDLPLKFGEKRKPKSQSNKSVSRSKHEDFDEVQKQGYTGKLSKENRGSITRKHQMSLCNNVHGIEICEEERNLYKMLLKTKFKL